MLKSPTVVLGLFIIPYWSVSVCFIYLGAILLDIQISIFISFCFEFELFFFFSRDTSVKFLSFFFKTFDTLIF